MNQTVFDNIKALGSSIKVKIDENFVKIDGRLGILENSDVPKRVG